MRRLQVEVPFTGSVTVDIEVDDLADATDIAKAAVYAANEYVGDIYGPEARFQGEALAHLSDESNAKTPDLRVLCDEEAA
jgi:hypothetical protein